MGLRTPRPPFTTTWCGFPTSAKSTSAKCSSRVTRAASPWCASNWAAQMAVKWPPPRAKTATAAPGVIPCPVSWLKRRRDRVAWVSPILCWPTILASVLLLPSAGTAPTAKLDVLFTAATDDLHAAELAKAQLAAEHGIDVAAARHDLVYQWKFRLLRAEILLNGGRPEEVQLHDTVPPGPQFAALAARKTDAPGPGLVHLERHGPHGRWDALLEAAHRAAEAAHAEEVLLDIENLQSLRLMRRRQYDPAELVLRSALQRARGLHSTLHRRRVRWSISGRDSRAAQPL